MSNLIGGNNLLWMSYIIDYFKGWWVGLQCLLFVAPNFIPGPCCHFGSSLGLLYMANNNFLLHASSIMLAIINRVCFYDTPKPELVNYF